MKTESAILMALTSIAMYGCSSGDPCSSELAHNQILKSNGLVHYDEIRGYQNIEGTTYTISNIQHVGSNGDSEVCSFEVNYRIDKPTAIIKASAASYNSFDDVGPMLRADLINAVKDAGVGALSLSLLNSVQVLDEASAEAINAELSEAVIADVLPVEFRADYIDGDWESGYFVAPYEHAPGPKALKLTMPAALKVAAQRK